MASDHCAEATFGCHVATGVTACDGEEFGVVHAVGGVAFVEFEERRFGAIDTVTGIAIGRGEGD